MTGHTDGIECESDDDTGGKGAYVIAKSLFRISTHLQLILSVLYLWELYWHFSREPTLSLPWDIHQPC